MIATEKSSLMVKGFFAPITIFKLHNSFYTNDFFGIHHRFVKVPSNQYDFIINSNKIIPIYSVD